MPMPDAGRTENAGILTYLERSGTTEPDPHPDDADRYRLGTHPDIVARLWDELAAAFDADARAVVHGTPALVDPSSRVVMAVGLGTTYALRLAPGDAAGGTTVHVYASVGRTLDLGETFGPGWVFGTHDPDEVAAIRRATELL